MGRFTTSNHSNQFKYDSEGYDRSGYNKYGYDRNGRKRVECNCAECYRVWCTDGSKSNNQQN